MERSYRILTELADFERVFQRLEQDGLFWALDCEWESPERARWLRRCAREDVLMLEGLVDGEPAGVLKLSPFMARTRCGEIGVAAYRDFFRHAAWLARGACLWCFERMDCESLVGRVAAPNRHALFMAPKVGFRVLGRVPGMCWHGKKQQFVDGVLVLATPESVREAESAPRSASDAGTTFPASESECPAGRGAERHGNIPPGRREPRSASDAGTPLPASESECRPGRPTERHGEERREPRGASDAGTPLPASESECPVGRGAERHEEEA